MPMFLSLLGARTRGIKKSDMHTCTHTRTHARLQSLPSESCDLVGEQSNNHTKTNSAKCDDDKIQGIWKAQQRGMISCYGFPNKVMESEGGTEIKGDGYNKHGLPVVSTDQALQIARCPSHQVRCN